MLPNSVTEELRDHLVRVQRQHEQDLVRGFGAVPLPYALDRKYPNANRDWVWQKHLSSRPVKLLTIRVVN